MPMQDPRLRIPPTKTSMPVTQAQQGQQQNVNTPKNPMTSGPLNPMQPQPAGVQMKKGGAVKCMKKGGVTGKKTTKTPYAPTVKGGPVIGKTKRGYGAARRG